RGKQNGGIELLHHRIALRKERRGEIQRERGIGVKIIPFDQVAHRADEDRLDPALDVREDQMVVRRGYRHLIRHVLLSLQMLPLWPSIVPWEPQSQSALGSLSTLLEPK